jgi:hypothetical protein
VPWRAVRDLEKSLLCRPKRSEGRIFQFPKKKFGLFPAPADRDTFFQFFSVSKPIWWKMHYQKGHQNNLAENKNGL